MPGIVVVKASSQKVAVWIEQAPIFSDRENYRSSLLWTNLNKCTTFKNCERGLKLDANVIG
jgi:hypothetical protein